MSTVTTSDLAAAQAVGSAQVIDVREPAEFATGHVPGAASIPMSQLVDRLAEIDRTRPMFVICQAGGRSSAMTDVLRHHGFDAHSVDGGTAAWIAGGHPVDTRAQEGK
jgi:rhodanese-related sulfurtransferase